MTRQRTLIKHTHQPNISVFMASGINIYSELLISAIRIADRPISNSE